MAAINNPSLGAVPMADVIRIFADSTEHLLGNYLPDARPELDAFIAAMVLQEKPYMLVTDEGVQRARIMVFSKETIRDFILSLAFNFFGRLAADENTLFGVARALADGTTFHGYGADAKFNRMPQEISERLEPTSSTVELLKANKWLMVLLLIQLSISVKEPPKSRKTPTPNT